jgi:hypothetical protein
MVSHRHSKGALEAPDRTRQPWLVMQLLRGSSLETLIDGAVFSGPDTPGVAWAAAIVAQIAAVLADVHLGAGDPLALDCAYQAGHACAQAGKPDKALPQLRYYVLNAAPLAAAGAEEAAKVMESRFVIAQLLASTGEAESAIAELRAVRPLVAAAYGPDSAQARNLDKQAAYRVLGFEDAAGGDEVFRHLVLARIIEPVSKLDSLRVLEEAGVTPASYRTGSGTHSGTPRPRVRGIDNHNGLLR